MSDSNSTLKVWLVTGSAHGLGRAIAEAALAAGHALVGRDVSDPDHELRPVGTRLGHSLLPVPVATCG